jgi:hypothetical protein
MCGDGFPTAAFSDDTQDFPSPHGQINTFHRANRAFVQWKGHSQVFDL